MRKSDTQLHDSQKHERGREFYIQIVHRSIRHEVNKPVGIFVLGFWQLEKISTV